VKLPRSWVLKRVNNKLLNWRSSWLTQHPHPNIALATQILKRLKASPVNVPNAVKVKKYFQMNLTGRTPAAPATSRSILPNANWKAKAKAFPHANECGLAAGDKIKLFTKPAKNGFRLNSRSGNEFER
jgi:hypothetical protein